MFILFVCFLFLHSAASDQVGRCAVYLISNEGDCLIGETSLMYFDEHEKVFAEAVKNPKVCSKFWRAMDKRDTNEAQRGIKGQGSSSSHQGRSGKHVFFFLI